MVVREDEITISIHSSDAYEPSKRS